jgi:hypothetical protein
VYVRLRLVGGQIHSSRLSALCLSSVDLKDCYSDFWKKKTEQIQDRFSADEPIISNRLISIYLPVRSHKTNVQLNLLSMSCLPLSPPTLLPKHQENESRLIFLFGNSIETNYFFLSSFQVILPRQNDTASYQRYQSS